MKTTPAGMAAKKRGAERQLTMDNYDDDEEADDGQEEDVGPRVAPQEVLKQRPMAKARRRSDLNVSGPTADDDNDGETEPKKLSAFKGFTGFKGFSANPLQSSAFKTLSSTPIGAGIGSTSTITSTPVATVPAATATSGQTNGADNNNTTAAVAKKPTLITGDDEDTAEDVYDRQLSKLNKCFADHIQRYLQKSYAYDFTPVCQEYIQYHKKIESAVTGAATATTKFVADIKPMTKASVGLFGSAAGKDLSAGSDSKLLTTGGTGFGAQTPLTFGLTNTQQSSQSSTCSSIGAGGSLSQASATDNTVGFSLFKNPGAQSTPSFGGFGANSKPFGSGGTGSLFTMGTVESQFGKSSGAGSQSSATDSGVGGEEESEEPPKVESVQHKEPDSVYTKKCRLYYKREDNWVDKGLGYLYIVQDQKPGAPAAKPQLLIRADNTMGTILLHIGLVDSLPVMRAPGNKGALLTCVPHPPLDPKAAEGSQTSVTFWIKVGPNNSEESANARVVNVSSIAHIRGALDFEDIQSEKSYDKYRAYSQSKLANVLFTRELAVRLSGTNIRCYALHPGLINTDLQRHLTGCLAVLFRLCAQVVQISAELGAQTTHYCALEPSLASETGRYYKNCGRVDSMVGNAADDLAAKKLWEISCKAVDIDEKYKY
ncbi:unnamed protein product [Medioppia subpectinata]|uniref:Nuclear pore complex NUP2/50/61 domain-containing protein n=1 Tax=Medioppia subpectinata TaxID=1979941 RepID=A0A7R9Q137_9ACAR|nr:unnamed protein product [Medioppia subpectinata]CAG2108154.1 unnamed protein product [Medioppia subpectinata]